MTNLVKCTSTCKRCHKDFSYMRKGTKGNHRNYCDLCRRINQREAARRAATKKRERGQGHQPSRNIGKPPKRQLEGRTCKYDECETPLSVYNKGEYCSVHERTVAEEERAAVRREEIRSEIEDERLFGPKADVVDLTEYRQARQNPATGANNNPGTFSVTTTTTGGTGGTNGTTQ